MARLRGFERYNTVGVGADLVIKKLNPGVDEGVGYLVSVFQDGDFKDRLKITSKKKLKELIDSFKDYYKTDKAFLNGMLFHITYKNEKEQKMPRSHKAPEEKHNEENEDKEAMVKNIDESLYRKAAVIERHLNRLFDPELPSVVRTAEEQEQPSGNITEEFVRKSKEEIEKFVSANKELAEGSESYQLYNALQRWVADVNAKVDNGEYQGLDADKAKADLADYFSNYEFLKEKRAASSTVIITDDNIEQLLDSLDSAVNIDPTDDKVESVVDTLNQICGSSTEQVESAKCIADEASKNISNRSNSEIVIAMSHAVEMLVKRFKDDTKSARYSGTLRSVVASWAVHNEVDIKMAELVYKFCEADFNPERSLLKIAAIVFAADTDNSYANLVAEATNEYGTQIQQTYAHLLKNLNAYDSNSILNTSDEILNSFTSTFSFILESAIELDIINSTDPIADDYFVNKYKNISIACSRMLEIIMGNSRDYAKATSMISKYVEKNIAGINGQASNEDVIRALTANARQLVSSSVAPATPQA